MNRLFALVADFPFAPILAKHDGQDVSDQGMGNKCAWLAALLTPFARAAINGPCPLFLFDANTSGSGKTKLCDLVAIAATGREMPRTNYAEDDKELAAQVLTIAVEADRMVLFDNVATGRAFGSPAIDAALTGKSIKCRILGKTGSSGEVPFRTIVYATGNNLNLRGDALRRVVPCRLESPEDRPEERKGFKIKGDLLVHATRVRGQVVADVLTILRGFVVAGRPKNEALPSMDYVAWEETVRHAVFWATGTDPCEGRRESIKNDDATSALASVLDGWTRLCELAGSASQTVAEALTQIEVESSASDEAIQGLRATFLDWSRDGKLPTAKSIGQHLAKIRCKPNQGRALDFLVVRGIRTWFVKTTRTTSS